MAWLNFSTIARRAACGHNERSSVRLRASVRAVWPPRVEVIAAIFRAAGADARLEELREEDEEFPGPGIAVEAFDCDGRVVVVLVPADRDVDLDKLGCAS